MAVAPRTVVQITQWRSHALPAWRQHVTPKLAFWRERPATLTLLHPNFGCCECQMDAATCEA